jgi:hypothetical protein
MTGRPQKTRELGVHACAPQRESSAGEESAARAAHGHLARAHQKLTRARQLPSASSEGMQRRPRRGEASAPVPLFAPAPFPAAASSAGGDLAALPLPSLLSRLASRPELFFAGAPGTALSKALRAALKSLTDEGACVFFFPARVCAERLRRRHCLCARAAPPQPPRARLACVWTSPTAGTSSACGRS